MDQHIFDSKNSNIDYDNEPENTLLHQRPSISIRAKVAVSFSLFFILSFTVIGWSYWILTKLENKIDFLEIADNYMVEIQQARRFEKNYLLYRTDLNDALEHLKTADAILTKNSKKIENILGRDHFETMVSYMLKYHDQLVMLQGVKNEVGQEAIVPQLRKFGSQMVSFAGEFVEKESMSVTRMFLLAKRVPMYFMSAALILMIFVLFFLTRHLMVTLNRFMAYTKRIGEGDFSPIKPAKKYKDEFTKLAAAFNHMIKELDHKQKVLLESQKLRAIGTLVAGVCP